MKTLFSYINILAFYISLNWYNLSINTEKENPFAVISTSIAIIKIKRISKQFREIINAHSTIRLYSTLAATKSDRPAPLYSIFKARNYNLTLLGNSSRSHRRNFPITPREDNFISLSLSLAPAAATLTLKTRNCKNNKKARARATTTSLLRKENVPRALEPSSRGWREG